MRSVYYVSMNVERNNIPARGNTIHTYASLLNYFFSKHLSKPPFNNIRIGNNILLNRCTKLLVYPNKNHKYLFF